MSRETDPEGCIAAQLGLLATEHSWVCWAQLVHCTPTLRDQSQLQGNYNWQFIGSHQRSSLGCKHLRVTRT